MIYKKKNHSYKKRIFTPKSSLMSRNASYCILQTIKSFIVPIWITALACSESKLLAKSHFRHFRIIDLISGQRLTQDLELWYQRLRLVASNTLVFNLSFSSIMSQTRPPPPPPPSVPTKECWRGLDLLLILAQLLSCTQLPRIERRSAGGRRYLARGRKCRHKRTYHINEPRKIQNNIPSFRASCRGRRPVRCGCYFNGRSWCVSLWSIGPTNYRLLRPKEA